MLTIKKLLIPLEKIWRISAGGLAPVHMYVVQVENKSFIVDAMTRNRARAIAAVITSRPEIPRPSEIVLTHCHGDHTGSAAALSQLWSIPCLCSEAEQPFVSGEKPLWTAAAGRWTAQFLRMSQTLGLVQGPPVTDIRHFERVDYESGWVVVPIPGHTPGHIALWREHSRTLIAGDGLFNFFDRLSRDPFPGVSIDPRAEWSAIERLSALEPDHLLLGHGRAIIGNATARIREYLERLGKTG